MNANRIDARAFMTYLSLPRKRIRRVEYWNAIRDLDEPSHLIHEVKNKLNIRGSSIHRQWGLRLKVFQALADMPDRSEIREAIRPLCSEFDDAYWADKDLKHEFPFEFAAAIADGGWLGIAMPAEFGGSGLGVTEAAIVLQEIGHSAGTLAACAAVGEEGNGFRYILDSLIPERILNAAEVISIGRGALERAVSYANERAVFGRKIGQNSQSNILSPSAGPNCMRPSS
jgi:hypothetical protein